MTNLTKTKFRSSENNANIMENLAIIPDVKATEKGFYAPVLTTSEMNTFVPTYASVLIFNSDTNLFMTFSNNQWVNLVEKSVNEPVFPVCDFDPVNPLEGTSYYNQSTKLLRIFAGNKWGSIPIVFDSNMDS